MCYNLWAYYSVIPWVRSTIKTPCFIKSYKLIEFSDLIHSFFSYDCIFIQNGQLNMYSYEGI